MTTVINIKTGDKFDVYIGRPGRGHAGTFGNPYEKGKTCKRCLSYHGTGSSTLPCFKKYFEERLERDPLFRKAVLALRGKRLGCFCKPANCHGDVIIEWLNNNEF